jgi:hypothetical protein
MDISQYVLLGAVIAGVTEFITRLRGRDFWVAATILIAAIIGGLFGFFHYYPDFDVVQGIAAGFGASGALTAIGHVGNKSVATPSPLTK